MRLLRALLLTGLVAATVTGCAKPVSPLDQTSTSMMSYQDPAASRPMRLEVTRHQMTMPEQMPSTGTLAGRTLHVATTTDIILRPREVVLTFDDGPRAGKTPAILDTLDQYGVKATFLMLGSAAKANPSLARKVALKGHSVGSHTYDHTDLATLSRQDALNEIARGETAVAEALDGAGDGLSPFFRFPYLSQTGFLRTNLLSGDIVVLDVDIDSKDYYKDSAKIVLDRTIERLEARGSGIILFHDIHQRTVDMLPSFLAELQTRGYSVVHLKPTNPGVFGRPIITADVDLSAAL